MTITLPNQSIHLLRQLLCAPGLSKTPADIYRDGELLCVVLPEPDVSWVVAPDDRKAWPLDEREAYTKKDNEWSAKEVTLDLTDKQRDRIRDRMTKALELVNLPNSKFAFRLYKEFGFAPAE